MALLVSVIAVSKPLLAFVATTGRWLGFDPARTFHEVTWVSPSQLAYTVTLPLTLRAAPLGGKYGVPTQLLENSAR